MEDVSTAHVKQISSQSDKMVKLNGQKCSSQKKNIDDEESLNLNSEDFGKKNKNLLESSNVIDNGESKSVDVSHPEVEVRSAAVQTADNPREMAIQTADNPHEAAVHSPAGNIKIAEKSAAAGMQKKKGPAFDSLCMCRCKVCHEQMYHHELKKHWKR
jgi:hypothetical protein